MATYYSEEEIDSGWLSGKTVGILGYGSQGRAQALNLRDSGVNVLVGQRLGRSWDRANEDGFQPLPLQEVAQRADVLTLSLPDVTMRHLFAAEIAPWLRSGQTLVFVHGFNVRYGLIDFAEKLDVVLVSPKAVGPKLRTEALRGSGVAALIGIHQNASGNALKTALSYAWHIGCRSPLVSTTFKEETETDLFGEQAVLCGGLSALVKAAFETLVEAGYQPEAAYFECVHEVKLIADLLYEGGLTKVWNSISDTAEWGAQLSGTRIVNEQSRAAMRELLRGIQDGSFAESLIQESEDGNPRLLAFRERDEHSDLEQVGSRLRELMPNLRS